MTLEPDKMFSFGPPLLDPKALAAFLQNRDFKVVVLFNVLFVHNIFQQTNNSNSSNGF